MKTRRLLAALVLALSAHVASAVELTPTQVTAVVDEVVKSIESYYLFPEKRAGIAGAIRDAQKAGRYNVTDAGELAGRISEDLVTAGNDKHLSLIVDPGEYAAITAPEPEDPSAVSKARTYEEDRARARNAGVEELRILTGNIRYARITNFLWGGEESGRAIEEACRFLRDGQAIIIDLRGNGGGAAVGVLQWISHFFDERRHLISFYSGVSGETRQNHVIPYLPAGRLTGRPLFVLTDRGTGSAAEEFAYHVRHFELGTLVGDTTIGAANNPAHLPIAPAFILRVSSGRPIHPVTNTNWEGAGVAPHVAIPAPQALDKAHLLALEKLATTATDDAAKARVEWGLAGARARLERMTLTPAQLDAYTGQFEGPRGIKRTGTTLTYQRADGPIVTLTPMANDLFAYDTGDSVRIRFEREAGRVVALHILSPDRHATRAARVR